MLKYPTVAVVDDDKSVRESLPDLIRELGFEAQSFSSAEEFLDSKLKRLFRCVILDVAMPGMDGFDLQQALGGTVDSPAIIFITANRDESIRRRALDRGAVDCLYKPFSDTALLQALKVAIGSD